MPVIQADPTDSATVSGARFTQQPLKVQSPCRLSNCFCQFVLRLSVFKLRLQQERLGLQFLRRSKLGLGAKIGSLFESLR